MENKEFIEIFKKVAKKRPYNLSDNTIETYIKNVNYMVKYLNHKNISDITNKDLRGYFLELGLSDNTYNLKLSSFKTFYEVLLYYPQTEDFIKENPTEGISVIKSNKKVKQKIPLTKNEQDLLIKFSKNSRDKAIIITLLNTGLRIHELINLTLEQYLNRDESGKIYLEVNKGSHDGEYIILGEKTISEIDKYIKVRNSSSEYLFVSNQGNKMDRTCISRTIKTIARRSGEFTEDRIIQLCNHLFRATCATDLAERDVPIDVISRKLRHSSISTTMIYVKTSDERLKKYIN